LAKNTFRKINATGKEPKRKQGKAPAKIKGKIALKLKIIATSLAKNFSSQTRGLGKRVFWLLAVACSAT